MHLKSIGRFTIIILVLIVPRSEKAVGITVKQATDQCREQLTPAVRSCVREKIMSGGGTPEQHIPGCKAQFIEQFKACIGKLTGATVAGQSAIEDGKAAPTNTQQEANQAQQKSPPATLQDLRRYDGPWTGTLVCESTSPALPGWRYEFRAEVSKGAFRGQRGPTGKPGSETFEGTIEPNGNAKITQIGLSGDSKKDPFHRPEGTEFRNNYSGSFSEAHGRLTRVNRSSCNIDFSRRAEVRSSARTQRAAPSRITAAAQHRLPCEEFCIRVCSARATGGSSQTTCSSGCVPRCHMSRAGIQ